MARSIPIYEFECGGCGERFEELLAATAGDAPCPRCGSARTSRRLSPVAPPGRQPRGPKVRSAEARRREREASRRKPTARRGDGGAPRSAGEGRPRP